VASDPHGIRSGLAKRIMAAAAEGERDPKRLKLIAMGAISDSIRNFGLQSFRSRGVRETEGLAGKACRMRSRALLSFATRRAFSECEGAILIVWRGTRRAEHRACLVPMQTFKNDKE
jgi:hypothetical protein